MARITSISRHEICRPLRWVGGASRSCIVLAGRSHTGKATAMYQPTPHAHVLVINDAQAMIDGLPGLLANAGYRVSHATSSLDCPRIRMIMPDVIVQDLMVAQGRQTCWQFLSLVRQEEDLMHIPLILCPDAREMICNPVMDFNLQRLGVRVLRRPFIFDDVLRTVSDVLVA